MGLLPSALAKRLDGLRNRFVLRTAGLGARGPGCYIGPRLRLAGAARMSLGSNVHIGRDCLLSCEEKGSSIRLGDNVGVGDGVRVEAYGGTVSLQDNSALLPGCIVYGHGGVSIGRDVYVAARSILVAANHVFDRTDMLIREQGDRAEGIVIEDDCWLGAGVRVLDGVTIGTGSVVGAGSVVSRSIPPYSIAMGVPARVVRSRGD